MKWSYLFSVRKLKWSSLPPFCISVENKTCCTINTDNALLNQNEVFKHLLEKGKLFVKLIWYYETLDFSFTTDKELDALDRPVSHQKPQRLRSPYSSGFFSELHCLWLKNQKGLTHFKRRKSYFLGYKLYSLLAEKQLQLNPPEKKKGNVQGQSHNTQSPQESRENTKYTRSRLAVQKHWRWLQMTLSSPADFHLTIKEVRFFWRKVSITFWQGRFVPLFSNNTSWWEVLHTVMKNNNLSSKSFWKV